MRRILGFLLFAVLVVVGLYFGQLNAQRVTLDLHYIALDLPLSVVVMGSVVAGALIGVVILFLGVVLPQKARLRRLSREIAKAPDAQAASDDDG